MMLKTFRKILLTLSSCIDIRYCGEQSRRKDPPAGEQWYKGGPSHLTEDLC